MAETVRVKAGGKQYELSNGKEVFEIVNGKKVRAKQNGDAILRLFGHTLKSRKDYKKSYGIGDSSFDTRKYWNDYASKYGYGSSGSTVATSEKNSPKPTTAKPRKKPVLVAAEPNHPNEISGNGLLMAELQAENERLRQENVELKKERKSLHREIRELRDEIKGLRALLTEKGILDPEEPIPVDPIDNEIQEPVIAPSKWDNFRNTITGRKAHAYFVTREPIDENNWHETRVEEDNGHKSLRALGAAALVGAGVLVGYLIWGRHTGHHDILGTVQLPNGNNNHSESTNHLLQSNFRNHGLQTWNDPNSNPSVAIGLPDDGHLRIVTDTQGHHDLVKVGDNTPVIDNINMTRTGAISPDSLNQAADHGVVKIGQEHLSYFDSDGPSLRNGQLVEAPGWNTHTVTVLSES